MPKSVAVSIAKLNSERCPYKLLRPLGSTTVIEHHLRILSSIQCDERWFVTRDEPLISIARNYDVTHVNRTQKSTASTTFYDLWCDVAKRAKDEDVQVVAWINACCPFINVDRIYRLMQTAPAKTILPVCEIETPYWDHLGAPIAERKILNTQSSAKSLALSHSFWVRTPQMMLDALDQRHYAGQHSNAKLERIGQIESLDIDDEASYIIANATFTTLMERQTSKIAP